MFVQRCQPLAASAPSNGAALDLSKSPQEMLKIFRETQQNMIELNKSRLAALEEVKALRARVSLLGKRSARPCMPP